FIALQPQPLPRTGASTFPSLTLRQTRPLRQHFGPHLSRPSLETTGLLWENPAMSTGNHKKILIVEDEKDILQLVKLYLEKEGYRTVSAMTGTEGLRQVKAEHPDLIILDLMLPEMDGLEVCKRIRLNQDTALLPILMLTAKAEESDTVIGLELGADDYVTKPFSPKALVARVKALLRRLERNAAHPHTHYQYGPLTVDLSRHEVRLNGQEVTLTAKEFGLLEHLHKLRESDMPA
ncbi:MAG: response regulator transcription factor, partial [Nitrospira sp.]|nr:response regulator transcription factor [Nitrospira sp.]